MPVVVTGVTLRTGVSCALCHSSVHPDTHEVIHGAPNVDLNAGMLLALASNTAAYLTHTHIRDLGRFATDPGRTVLTAAGQRIALPDPAALEDAVDRVLMSWPPAASTVSATSSTTRPRRPTASPGATTRSTGQAGSWRGRSMA
jgi:hypothetical protein